MHTHASIVGRGTPRRRRAPPGAAARQALYRCHGAHVVFVGFLPLAASMLTVDQRGLAALWPADGVGGGCRSGARAWLLVARVRLRAGAVSWQRIVTRPPLPSCSCPGFGWFKPHKCFQLPRTLAVCQAR